MTEFAADLKEMMDGFDKIMAAARQQFPSASEEEIYQITHKAFCKTLGFAA